jgi:hypothetical protein
VCRAAHEEFVCEVYRLVESFGIGERPLAKFGIWFVFVAIEGVWHCKISTLTIIMGTLAVRTLNDAILRSQQHTASFRGRQRDGAITQPVSHG